MPSVPPCHLLTLGRLALLDAAGADVLPRDVAKPLALLAYLTAAPGRRCSRERLVDLFWGDSTLEHGRASLRQVIYRLREALGDDALLGESTDLVLTPQLATDREAFLRALEQGDLESALSLYHGAFIEGFVSRGTTQFEQWRDQEQDRLHDLFTNTIEIAGQRAIAAGRAAEAAALAKRVLEGHPLDERGWRLRLQAEQLTGSRIHPAASIAEFRRLFTAEGWEPQPRTLQLIEAMERTRVVTDATANPDPLEGDLVGRDAVMAALYHEWRQAGKRVGSHSHLVGGAGMGKSRILEDFAVRIRSERGRVAIVGAYPRQRYVPGAMLAAVIAALADFPGAVGVTPESARILIDLQPVVSPRFPAAAPASHRGDQQRTAVVGEALRDLIEAVTENGPVCLLLDDAHWWDEESRQYIEAFIERLGDRAMLVITASRPGTGEIATGVSGARAELPRWQTDDVLALLDGLGSTSKPEGAATLAAALAAAAEGVPLLVLEAIRLGLDRKLISLNRREWKFPALAEFLTLLRPGQLLRERTTSLSTRQRHLLLVTWLLEREVPREAALFGDGGATTGTLAELERLAFLVATSTGWRIGHDAIGEAIEEAASEDAIRAAHRNAASLSLEGEDHPIGLRQAAKHAVESHDAALQHRVALRWVRHRRSTGASASAKDLLGEVFPKEDHSVSLRELAHDLPPDLRHRPWSARRLAPIWAVAGAAVALAAFTLLGRMPTSDMTLGIYATGGPGPASDHRIALRHDGWGTEAGFRISARPNAESPPWGSTPAESLSNGPISDPSGERWIFTRTKTDPTTGPTELVLQSGGSERVVAASAGDDALPAWSPDGRFVVFQSNRWTSGSRSNFDLAILTIATNQIRRITSDESDEMRPVWSPVGSRIAYIKRAPQAGADSVCWTSVDGRRRGCRAGDGHPVSSILGWRDASTLVIASGFGADCRFPLVNLDNGTTQELVFRGRCTATLSPDGSWLAWPLPDNAESIRPRVSVTSLSGVARTTEIVLPTEAGNGFGTYWRGPWQHRWLDQVSIRHRGDTLSSGSPYQLELRGLDQTGADLAIAADVVSWRSSDTTLAQVDSTGMLHPLRTGSVVVTGSAGGWRVAEARLVIAETNPTVVHTENWAGSWTARWVLEGDPRPTTIKGGKDGSPALLVNGDGTYFSSAYSAFRLDPRRGVALDAQITTPVTQPKWQYLRIGLSAVTGASRGGLTGNGACALAYPNGEGWEAHHRVATSAGALEVGSSLRSGSWYRVRVQIFPDGTCGFAINGRPVLRSETAIAPSDPVAITIEGQTVGAALIVGPLKLWSGVPGDIDWSKLRPALKR